MIIVSEAYLANLSLLMISIKLLHPSVDADSKLSPPDLLLASLKVKCKICKQNVKNHLKHYHTIHPGVCDICNHMEFISKNSCNLVCYVCMKKFETIYNLEDHMNIHNPEGNPHFCKVCDKGFPSSIMKGTFRKIMQRTRKNIIVINVMHLRNYDLSVSCSMLKRAETVVVKQV